VSPVDAEIRIGGKPRYLTRARKYRPGNAGLMVLVNESEEPLTVFV
jgi:hypothetical protein